jgi:ATP-dependent helicase HrpA
MRQEGLQSWLGARNRKFYLFPGSGLFKKGPKWVMAAELVETSKVYARTLAKIDPTWTERLAGHLVKRSYSEPHWEKRPAQVAATERVTLYGLPIVSGRKVNYGRIDPVVSREIFIQHALVQQEYDCKAPFFKHNRALIETLEDMEAKIRRRDLLVDEAARFAFYDERIPAGIYSGAHFEKWRAQAEKTNPYLLFFSQEALLAQESAPATEHQFPDYLSVNGMELPLTYRFEPGEPDDGVTVTVPLAALNQLPVHQLEWLVPGLLNQRLAALLKSLPKSLRRHFVPVPNFVEVLMDTLKPGPNPLTEAMTAQLLKTTGVDIPADAWKPANVPDHLRMRLRVIDADGKVAAVGRDLNAIKDRLKDQAQGSFADLPPLTFERDNIRDWDFGPLPEEVEFTSNGIKLKGYPALVAQQDGTVALRLLDSPERAAIALRVGLQRLITLQLRDKIKYLKRNLPGLQTMGLHFVTLGTHDELRDDLINAIVARAFLGDDPLPRDQTAFATCFEQGQKRLLTVANELSETVGQILEAYHQVRKLLSGDIPLGWQEAVRDIHEQLDSLIYKGFIARTPYEQLAHLPRYLKGIEARLQKLKQAPDRDRQRRGEIAQLWENYKRRVAVNAEQDVYDPELETFRWLLEELRISLFAQELKTAMPVSVKRLETRWGKMQN